MTPRRNHVGFLVAILLATCFLGLQAGCARVVANLVHAFKGNDIPAEFEGIEGKHVAIICATDDGIGTDANGILLARYMRELIDHKVEKVDMISQDDIDKWLYGQNQASINYVDVGRGVNADLVIAVEMMNLSLKEGATLFRGKSDLTLSVFDMKKSGKVVFRKHIPEFTYPTLAGVSSLETDETKFRKIYLTRVANRLARHFYPYELGADVASDVDMLSY